MQLKNIRCSCEEYRLVNDTWVLYTRNNCSIDSNVIVYMLDAGEYFRAMGGLQEIKYKVLKGFGVQVTKITCISSCKQCKKVYCFSYADAQHYS